MNSCQNVANVYYIDISRIYSWAVCCASTSASSDIRLVGGSNQYEGRVEVYRSGEWKTVCDNSWDIREAEVVCRQLGYGYAILAIQGAAFGEGSGDSGKQSGPAMEMNSA